MDYLTTREAAKLLGITVTQVLRNIRRGLYPSARKLGWMWTIRKEDLR